MDTGGGIQVVVVVVGEGGCRRDVGGGCRGGM